MCRYLGDHRLFHLNNIYYVMSFNKKNEPRSPEILRSILSVMFVLYAFRWINKVIHDRPFVDIQLFGINEVPQ